MVPFSAPPTGSEAIAKARVLGLQFCRSSKLVQCGAETPLPHQRKPQRMVSLTGIGIALHCLPKDRLGALLVATSPQELGQLHVGCYEGWVNAYGAFEMIVGQQAVAAADFKQ